MLPRSVRTARKDHGMSSSALGRATPSGPAGTRRRPAPVLWKLATALCVVVLLAACNSTTPPSAPAFSSSAPSPSPAPARAAVTPLDECDPAGYVPCDQQAAVLSIPIADTNLALTYSSQWAAGRQDRPNWNADSLGLGGWSINVAPALRRDRSASSSPAMDPGASPRAWRSPRGGHGRSQLRRLGGLRLRRRRSPRPDRRRASRDDPADPGL